MSRRSSTGGSPVFAQFSVCGWLSAAASGLGCCCGSPSRRALRAAGDMGRAGRGSALTGGGCAVAPALSAAAVAARDEFSHSINQSLRFTLSKVYSIETKGAIKVSPHCWKRPDISTRGKSIDYPTLPRPTDSKRTAVRPSLHNPGKKRPTTTTRYPRTPETKSPWFASTQSGHPKDP